MLSNRSDTRRAHLLHAEHFDGSHINAVRESFRMRMAFCCYSTSHMCASRHQPRRQGADDVLDSVQNQAMRYAPMFSRFVGSIKKNPLPGNLVNWQILPSSGKLRLMCVYICINIYIRDAVMHCLRRDRNVG